VRVAQATELAAGFVLSAARHKSYQGENMSIIITSRGQKPQRLDPLDFEQETNLQALIHDNPEAIPLSEIKSDIKLLVLAREFQTASGPIDALGVDKEGEIYVIETKLEKNPDKRAVVAQALDYGAVLWSHGSDFAAFTSKLDGFVREKFGVGLSEKLADFFVLDESGVETLLGEMNRNLNDGNFKFVIPMDRLHEPLKDLIVFLNHNCRFDFYAVEIEVYKHGDLEITIPKLFGGEVKKGINTPGSVTSRKQWSLDEVLADANARMSVDEAAAFEKLLRFSRENADEIRTGTGAYGTFSPVFKRLSQKSLFTAGADKRLSFNFDWVGRDNPDTRDRFKTEMESIGFRFASDYATTRPSLWVEEWGPKADAIVSAIQRMLAA
jgi:hypothetical protein